MSETPRGHAAGISSGQPPEPRRLIPRTDAVLAQEQVAAAAGRLGHGLVKRAVTAAQESARHGEIEPGDVVAATLRALPSVATRLRLVINATGVVLHTNLGRAPLSCAAREALDVAAGTCDVELDLTTGGRGQRGAATVEALLAAVPAATAAHVVNNGAAALALVAATLAAGREIVVSRGELVEIGDGFRIPELLTATGARLCAVGTTNRTHPQDYADAIGERTAFVLKIHPSNFVVTGFTSSVEVRELTGLGVPVVADIGSGLLAPHSLLPGEPDARNALEAGASIVTASADKLLGGPQAGLLLGAPGEGDALVKRIRRHPLARAMRVDKLTLAALEATLRGPVTPTRAALETDLADLRCRAEVLAARLTERGVSVSVIDSQSTVGGGGAPGVTIPSVALALPEHYAEVLRAGEPAVLGRIEHGYTLLDLRAVDPAADTGIAAAVLSAASSTLKGES